jgi:drug/metabolite transporter (DMT)-like permease
VDGIVLAAALASAVLHAAWNAMVKASGDPRTAMATQVIASGLFAAPMLLFLTIPSSAALPWLAGSAFFNLGAASALARGYAAGSFGLVYPAARATSPLLVVVLAAVLVGERPSAVGILGITLVSGGVALLTSDARSDHAGALGWALAAGTCIAAAALCDAQGLRASPSLLGYGFAASALNAAVMAGVRRHRGAPVMSVIHAYARVATVGVVLSTGSYLLILFVWSRAPIAVGTAVRDTSVVFAALIAWMLLKEPMRMRQVIAVLFAGLGVSVLRFS